MSSLFDSRRHEPLAAEPWSESKAREVIAEIANEAIQAFSSTDLYPAHPQDELGESRPGSAHYFGAGGVLWALDYLSRQGMTRVDTQWLVDGLSVIVDRVAAELGDSPLSQEVSYLFGDLPILMQLVELTGADEWRERLVSRISASVERPVKEMMWGTPGVLIATRLIQDTSVLDAIAEFEGANINKMFEQWNHELDGLMIWDQELYGERRPFIGPVHGFTGQVLPLLQRIDELDDERAALTLLRSKLHLANTARRGDGCANWPAVQQAAIDMPAMAQYCHGAPGVVTSYCAYPREPEVDQLLIEGGELTWQAGPLCKGSNLCHGTGGNGYAFLKLYERTGDMLWLDRARAFAMHGITQYEREKAKVGHQRFSLWTGDPGFAIYLAGCINVEAAFPTVDVF